MADIKIKKKKENTVKSINRKAIIKGKIKNNIVIANQKTNQTYENKVKIDRKCPKNSSKNCSSNKNGK